MNTKTQVTEISSYEKQAIDFLNATSTSLTVKYKEYGPYFTDEEDSRNIYSVTLRNKLGSYTFRFGQSIQGTRDNIRATSYDILACLTKYDPGTFEDFCGEYGYDTDSRKAEKTYKAVCKEYAALSRIFSAEQLEAMQEIQ